MQSIPFYFFVVCKRHLNEEELHIKKTFNILFVKAIEWTRSEEAETERERQTSNQGEKTKFDGKHVKMAKKKKVTAKKINLTLTRLMRVLFEISFDVNIASSSDIYQ